MDLRSFLRSLARTWWLMLPTFVLVLGGALVLTITQRPAYEASAQLLVEPAADVGSTSLGEIATLSRQPEVVATYARIASSRTITGRAADSLSLDDRQRADARVLGRLAPDGVLVQLVGRATDPVLARDVANAAATELVAYVEELGGPFSLTTVEEAVEPRAPVSPNLLVNLGLGAAIGLVLAVLVGAIAHLFDVRPRVFTPMQMLDAETSAYSEAFFMLRLRQEMSRSRRTGAPLAIALVNVNHRGALDGAAPRAHINALRRLAALFDAHLRTEDMSARLGRDTFALMLLDKDEGEAIEMVEGLRSRIALPAIGVDDEGAAIRAHPAAGVVEFHAEAITAEELVDRARRALRDAEAEPIGRTTQPSA
jgi:diguanylate cyclase (GGDEF)-like protein